MELIVLGTGNGGALKCYNTCFCIKNNGKHFLVDGGGGNQILSQLEKAKINIMDIRDIFVSHNHLDHIIGIIWVLRIFSYEGKNTDKCNIYASAETIETIKILCNHLLGKLNNTSRFNFIVLNDNEELSICDMRIKFFDIQARKEKQFGFVINNDFLVFTGDEPVNEIIAQKLNDCNWFLHEAFCLNSEVEMFSPYEKGHCSVKDAAIWAKKVNAKNLVMWHTEDNDLKNRKQNYIKEAIQFFKGNIFVPNDLEKIILD